MLPGGHWNKMLQETNDLQSFGRRGGLELAYGLKAIPCFAFTEANLSRLRSWFKKQAPFYLHSPWIVPLCRCRASSLGVGASRAPQLLVLLLARLASSTKQAWGRPPSKYFGLNLDCELCNTHTHTHTKTLFCCFCHWRWARRPFWPYSELCIWIGWKDLVQCLHFG